MKKKNITISDLKKRFNNIKKRDVARPTHEYLNYANILTVERLGKIYGFTCYGVNPGFGLYGIGSEFVSIPPRILKTMAEYHKLPWLELKDV